MNRNTKFALAGIFSAAAIAAMLMVPGQLALSADHFDSPARTDPAVNARADVAADIADVFAWYDANNVYVAMTLHNAGTFDRDLLHTINISTAAPATSAEVAIRWRFGPATNGTGTGISIEGLPGVTGNLVGPLETILSKDGVRAYAGVRDDPFFFDLQGFRTTRSTGTLSFNNKRNFFTGANDVAVIFEIPRARLGAGPFDVNGITARFGGLLS